MTSVFLNPKTVENMPATITRNNGSQTVPQAITKNTGSGLNGYTSPLGQGYPGPTNDITPAGFAYGRYQSLEDVAAPTDKPFYKIIHRCLGGYYDDGSGIGGPGSSEYTSFWIGDSSDWYATYYDLNGAGNSQGQELHESNDNGSGDGLVRRRNPAANYQIESVAITHDLINGLRWIAYMGAFYDTEAFRNLNWNWTQLEVVFADAPGASTNLTPANGATVTTGKPTAGLNPNYPASGQGAKCQWQFATDSGFTQDLVTVTESDTDLQGLDSFNTTTNHTEVLTEATRLKKNGTWYVRGRTIDSFGQAGPWTSPNQFTVNVAAPTAAPSAVSPAAASVVGTDIPALGATASGAPDSQPVKIEWQLATDAGFSLNIRSVIEPDSAFRVSGPSTYIVPNINQLFQGVWFIRARHVDAYGQTSPWSAANSFTVTHPPQANNLVPTGGKYIPFDSVAGVTFTWTFGDTSPVDFQTAYQIIIEKNSDGSLVLDTGKTVGAGTTVSLLISDTLKDVALRWKIRVWDSDDVTGGYSPYSVFFTSDKPTLTITSPVDNSSITSGRPEVDWMFTAPAGRTQAKYRVTFTVVGGSVAFDTNDVSSSATVYAPTQTILHNEMTYDIKVVVTDSVGLTQEQTVRVTTAFVLPPTVAYVADPSYYGTSGYVRVTWIATEDPFFLMWRIYRRLVGETEWTNVIGEVTEGTINEYHDWLVPSGASYEYAVVQVVDRFGEEVESDIPEGYIVSTVIEDGGYWLVDPIDETNNVELYLVKSDGYTKPRERAEYQVIGRGRHIDMGESLGITGSLVAQLRDDPVVSAREKKVKLEALADLRIPVYLRNPFGDVIYISLGDIAVDRIAGVGTSEFVDVTVPYEEVF